MFANVGGTFRGSFKTLVKVYERSLGFETKILPQYSLEIVVLIFPLVSLDVSNEVCLMWLQI